MKKIKITVEGWICEKCGNKYANWVTSCPNCVREVLPAEPYTPYTPYTPYYPIYPTITCESTK